MSARRDGHHDRSRDEAERTVARRADRSASSEGSAPAPLSARPRPRRALSRAAVIAMQRRAGNRAAASLVASNPAPTARAGGESDGAAPSEHVDEAASAPTADPARSTTAAGGDPPPDDPRAAVAGATPRARADEVSAAATLQRQTIVQRDPKGAVKDPPPPPPAPTGSKAPPAPPPPKAPPADDAPGKSGGKSDAKTGDEGADAPAKAGDEDAKDAPAKTGDEDAKDAPAKTGDEDAKDAPAKTGGKKGKDAPGKSGGKKGKTPAGAGGERLSPAEAAAQGKGPMAPDAERGYTELKKVLGPADPKVAEIFEQRADPQAKEHHQKLIAQAEGVRLDSLGYSYKPGGIGPAMLSLIWPASGVMEGWDRLTGPNMYSSGKGFVAGLQSGIDRYRGYLKILDEVAGWVSMIATIVAAIAALTIVGAPVAAVAMKVSIIAGLIQAGIKGFDAFLGIVQMLINIARARSTDDPVERARLCHQMKAESGMFTDSLTGAVLDAVTSVGGGAGKALARGGKAAWKAGSKGGLKAGAKAGGKSLFRSGGAALRLARIKAKLGLKQALKTAGRLRNVRAVGRLARIKVKTKVPGTKLWSASQKAQYQAGLKKKIASLRDHARLKYQPGKWKKVKSTAGQLAGATGLNAKTGLKKGMAHAAAVKGGGPSAPTPGDGPDIGLTYTKVAYWPSVLEQMGETRGDIHVAQKRMKGEYDKASKDAGDKRTAIIELKGEPSQFGTRLRMAGGQQQADAEAGKQKSEEAAAKSEEALGKKDAAKGPLDDANKEAKETQDAAQKAEQDAKRDEQSKSSGGFWDTLADAARSVYRATLGKLFNGLNKVKKWIGKTVLKLALTAAGLDEDDMDLAGMKSDSKKDAEADEKAKGDAEASKEKASAIDEKVALAKAGASEQEQAAMQAMVDSGDYIDALDTYDQALAQQQDHGTNYIDGATEAVSGAADAPLVTAAYVQPIADGAAWLQERSAALPGDLESNGSAAVSSLVADIESQGVSAEFAATLGYEVVGAWAALAEEVGGEITAEALALSSKATGLIDSDSFGVVDGEIGPAIDALGQHLEAFAGEATGAIAEMIQGMSAAYGGSAAGTTDEPAEPAPTAAPPPDGGDEPTPHPAPAPHAQPPAPPPPAPDQAGR